MAAFTGTQLAFELQTERRNHEARLAASLAPLVAELRTTGTRDAALAATARFHASYVTEGHADHDLVLIDATGRVSAGRLDHDVAPDSGVLQASVHLISPGMGPKPVTLRVTQDGSSVHAGWKRRWWSWAAHVGGTAVSILALLYFVIRHEVTGPIDRLLSGIRKMELGYWDDLPDPGGAWEVRWLGWRFRTLGQELSKTVDHLIAAQRRAYAGNPRDGVAYDAAPLSASPMPDAMADGLQPGDAIARQEALLERLRRADSSNVTDQLLAQAAWDRAAALAERLGRPDLAAGLEDAALRVLDPDGYREISARVDEARPRFESQARARAGQLRLALESRKVRFIEIQWRVKHPAGAWRKMQIKGLQFQQVHDLVALRIIVPAEADCYHALGVVHDSYTPIVGRFKDYVVAPKPNGYRGLHCSLRDSDGSVFEVQIRSVAMHRYAEMGSASHVGYRVSAQLPMTPVGLSRRWSLPRLGRRNRD